MTVVEPTLDFERERFAGGTPMVIGVDEVGRGAIAGPVAVGVAAILPDCAPMPTGLRDSKLLSEKRREELHPRVMSWTPHIAVGLADNEEVDRIGIIASLGLAGARAFAELRMAGLDTTGALVVLDGSHDWLTPALPLRLSIVTRVKADRDLAVVAAASVAAKVHRDRLMAEAHEGMPDYGWAGNKGYASAAHYEAVGRVGASPLHRWSWLRQPSLLDDLEAVGGAPAA
ncbi:ribonuclease HII [Homoserinibacter sp. YIM 151385]|uniref:ribonuclease HII n=1 Tax=Homoserinibacter sp. YIM 151385 TaxID=2985506 RepID=UPI0022F03187|nr:ribonuclease HII [Homoserinibacter sp. YIM 151385]WBU39173.1 ribonuclease HII [Homoserinibacter sp. YIM 151385]